MLTQRVPATTAQRNDKQAVPAKADGQRSAPQVLDLRQLKQVAGGTSLPAKFW